MIIKLNICLCTRIEHLNVRIHHEETHRRIFTSIKLYLEWKYRWANDHPFQSVKSKRFGLLTELTWWRNAYYVPLLNSCPKCLRCVHEFETILCYCAVQHEFGDNAYVKPIGVSSVCCTFAGKYNSFGYHQKWPLTCLIFCPFLINIQTIFWLFQRFSVTVYSNGLTPDTKHLSD